MKCFFQTGRQWEEALKTGKIIPIYFEACQTSVSNLWGHLEEKINCVTWYWNSFRSLSLVTVYYFTAKKENVSFFQYHFACFVYFSTAYLGSKCVEAVSLSVETVRSMLFSVPLNSKSSTDKKCFGTNCQKSGRYEFWSK